VFILQPRNPFGRLEVFFWFQSHCLKRWISWSRFMIYVMIKCWICGERNGSIFSPEILMCYWRKNRVRVLTVTHGANGGWVSERWIIVIADYNFIEIITSGRKKTNERLAITNVKKYIVYWYCIKHKLFTHLPCGDDVNDEEFQCDSEQ